MKASQRFNHACGDLLTVIERYKSTAGQLPEDSRKLAFMVQRLEEALHVLEVVIVVSEPSNKKEGKDG